MDEIVQQIGTRNNCTFCGVFRRQALDRGAVIAKACKIATGHNADDVAETVLLNLLRGDVARLSRTASATTGGDEIGGLTRVKPFKYSYEKEIVMYAYFKRLDYFSTECIYAPFAARGFARDFVKDLEAARPTAILDIIRSAENFRFPSQQRPPHADPANGGSSTPTPVPTGPVPRQCERCGYLSSQRVCKSCVMLEGLNKGRPGGRAPTLARTHADFSHQRKADGTEASAGPSASANATPAPSQNGAAATASEPDSHQKNLITNATQSSTLFPSQNGVSSTATPVAPAAHANGNVHMVGNGANTTPNSDKVNAHHNCVGPQTEPRAHQQQQQQQEHQCSGWPASSPGAAAGTPPQQHFDGQAQDEQMPSTSSSGVNKAGATLPSDPGSPRGFLPPPAGSGPGLGHHQGQMQGSAWTQTGKGVAVGSRARPVVIEYEAG
ncbi:hypothetical protein DUNSADRAFT_2803 [Dunaliella salina]|uniref:Cytoplasmic tRNA 2-thiolation protein 1 C-terminal domain-containing protein n=1 Tax=Dunaliella salina TaxID=3046 RepID=A0ABQ7GV76_DUNSA|nr:hypothetical protein DUNSADRAFT_2803 [Dunaliella salina]|eukprot:KAF5838474.1 hypothetical protein DUNSADRAFT_2803 [Dunaliella salina]